MITKDEEALGVAFAEIFSSKMMNVHTILPGKVISADAVTRTISVQPVIKRKYIDATAYTLLPVIEDVPICFPGCGDYFISFLPVSGDYVLLGVSERDISNWGVSGGIVEPKQKHVFDLSDAIMIGTLFPGDSVIAPAVESGKLVIRNKLKTAYISIDSAGQVDLNGNFTVDK